MHAGQCGDCVGVSLAHSDCVIIFVSSPDVLHKVCKTHKGMPYVWLFLHFCLFIFAFAFVKAHLMNVYSAWTLEPFGGGVFSPDLKKNNCRMMLVVTSYC